MKRIYVAGSYSADNVMDVLHNIGDGIKVSAQLLELNFAPFCPWLDYQFALMNERITKQQFYDYSMKWLESADAIVVLPNYEQSFGTQNEIRRASELGIPVFYNIGDLIFWRKSGKK